MKKTIFIYDLKALIGKKYKEELINFEELLTNNQSVKYWDYIEKEGSYVIKVEQNLYGEDIWSEPLSQASELLLALTEPIFNKSVRIAVDGLYEERLCGIEKLSSEPTKEFIKLMGSSCDITSVYLTDQVISTLITKMKYHIDNCQKEIHFYDLLQNSPKSIIPMLSKYLNEAPRRRYWYNFFTYFKKNNGFDLLAQSVKNNNELVNDKPSTLINTNQDLPY